MIYYFSGTGNSRLAALRLAEAIGQEARFIPHCNPYDQTLSGCESVGFVFPVYAWGVPPIVLDFIARLPQRMIEEIFENDIPVWAVAVCGDETGMAVEMLRKALVRRGVALAAAWSLIMPNVYVLLPGFGVDKKEVERRKLSDAVPALEKIAARINGGIWVSEVHEGSFPRLKTALVYPLFRRWGVDTRRWRSDGGCISCGKCAAVCPVGNISLNNGRPVWGTDCTSCCACFHVCPRNCIQYASITRGVAQYHGPDND